MENKEIAAAQYASQARAASIKMQSVTSTSRNDVLEKIASVLIAKKSEILVENQKDMESAKRAKLSGAIQDRLLLSAERIEDLASAVIAIRDQPEVLDDPSRLLSLEKPLEVGETCVVKQRVPIGVLAIIFESRPNVVIDCAALAIKSGNAAILKGGKEAKYSNAVLASIIGEASKNLLPEHTVQVLPSQNRSLTQELMQRDEDIDLLIPRGGEGLIRYVKAHSKIPVVAHDRGLCHLYVDEFANLQKAVKIALNAKLQRTGVCNALESLLIHQKVAEAFLANLADHLKDQKIELRVCQRSYDLLRATGQELRLVRATSEDWNTEYLDAILSVKVVCSSEEACNHIQEFGSKHTEAIVTESERVKQYFLSNIDASCVAINASTRFNDGGQLGLGAEIGISTSKLHAYGPMGARELTTERFIVIGNASIRI